MSEKYGGKLGIIWLDAHPDISGVKDSSHLHEMVLGNLLGLQKDSSLSHVEAPVAKERVIMAGLIEERLRVMDHACRDHRNDDRRTSSMGCDESQKDTGICFDLPKLIGNEKDETFT